MKKYITGFFIVAFAVILFACTHLYKSLVLCQAQLSRAENNTKALLLENENLDFTTRTLKLSIEQLQYFSDSISRTLKRTIKESKIKESKISQLQYMLSTNYRVDTLRFKDTIFVNNLQIDTTITDSRWYNLKLSLKAPNTIVVNPKFNNEFITIFNAKKETINPPKKFFLARWFQKKHIVTETTIINNNPYSSVDTTRVIEIVKL